MSAHFRVCLIPARGGSKRLPRKNVLPFLGRPMLLWPYDAARNSKIFDDIVVSTEDSEISSVAAAAGAKVDDRPRELASDTTGVVDVCLDFLDREYAAGRRWRQIAVVYPTAVLCTAEDINATVAMLDAGDCDFAMGVTDYERYPHLALRSSEDGGLKLEWPEYLGHGTNAPEFVVCNGSVMAAGVDALKSNNSFYGNRLRGHRMPRSRSVDIDTAEDLELAAVFARLGPDDGGSGSSVAPG